MTKKDWKRKRGWTRALALLKTFNKEFKNINESTKKAKKCQKQYYNKL